MICRQSTMGFNRLVLELLNQLHKGGLENVDRTAAAFLKEQKAPTRVWPTDEDVSHALVSSPLYRLLTRGRLRLILEGVEGWLRSSGKSEDTTVSGNLTIEHVMPVGWRTEEWPLPIGVDEGEARYRRNALIHTVGNLANLESLHLNENQLSGEIPPELGNLANLESLHLNENQLSGEIPPELGNLANLTRLRLGENELSGCLPSSLSGRDQRQLLLPVDDN